MHVANRRTQKNNRKCKSHYNFDFLLELAAQLLSLSEELVSKM